MKKTVGLITVSLISVFLTVTILPCNVFANNPNFTIIDYDDSDAVAMSFDSLSLNGELIAASSEGRKITDDLSAILDENGKIVDTQGNGKTLEFEGWVALETDIRRIGFYHNGHYSFSGSYNLGYVTSDDPALQYAHAFKVTADISFYSGLYYVGVCVQLVDNTIVLLNSQKDIEINTFINFAGKGAEGYPVEENTPEITAEPQETPMPTDEPATDTPAGSTVEKTAEPTAQPTSEPTAEQPTDTAAESTPDLAEPNKVRRCGSSIAATAALPAVLLFITPAFIKRKH